MCCTIAVPGPLLTGGLRLYHRVHQGPGDCNCTQARRQSSEPRQGKQQYCRLESIGVESLVHQQQSLADVTTAVDQRPRLTTSVALFPSSPSPCMPSCLTQEHRNPIYLLQAVGDIHGACVLMVFIHVHVRNSY